MGFGGGGGSGYVPPVTAAPVQKVSTPKPVTEAATSARQSQKDKASRAAGIQGSILTSPMSSVSKNGKTLLGQ